MAVKLKIASTPARWATGASGNPSGPVGFVSATIAWVALVVGGPGATRKRDQSRTQSCREPEEVAVRKATLSEAGGPEERSEQPALAAVGEEAELGLERPGVEDGAVVGVLGNGELSAIPGKREPAKLALGGA